MESEMRRLEITVTNPMSRFEIRFPHRILLPLVSIPLLTSAFPNTKKNSNEAIQRSYYSNKSTVGMGFWNALPRVPAIISRLSDVRVTQTVSAGVQKRANVYAPDSGGREARWIGARELRKPRIPGKLELLPVDSPR